MVDTAIVVALVIRELDPCKDKDSPDCSEDKMHHDSKDKSKEHSGSRREAAPVSSSTMTVDRLMPTWMAIGATLAVN